jgi:D-alanyl-D-alanine carboxypeptidase/D-alanyl-D-alanine-endopeptidase (penicillin-binding protein 4)
MAAVIGSGTTRRGFLAGGACLIALPAAGAGPLPRPRPATAAAAPEGLAAVVARSGLADLSGVAVWDIGAGRLIEGHQPDIVLPPASLAKVPTALYARERLGAGHRFVTRLRATGPVADGRIEGDLVLEGGGDPLLDTDALGDMAQALADAGVRAIAGRFRVTEGALPAIDRIEADQPEEAGYNPAISGLNLNFNRVHLAWSPGANGPALRLSAPGQRFEAEAPLVVARADGQGAPRHRRAEGREQWSLPPGRLRGHGSVWLPVRAPAAYAGTTFRGLAAQAGIDLPEPQVEAGPVAGRVLAEHAGETLTPMLRGMLHYSTNLTAEVLGISAAQAGGLAPSSLADSAGEMTDWARARFGLHRAAFVNHSGLTDRSALTATETVTLLARAENLADLLRERPVLGPDRQPVATPGVRMLAKTGTLNFTSALAGYLVQDGRPRLAFAILSADSAARAAIPPEARSDPPGSAAWIARARGMQQALLRRWIAAYL